jgi:hypothetical protein
MEERHKTGGGCAACRVLAVLNACSRRRDLARFGRWKGTPAECGRTAELRGHRSPTAVRGQQKDRGRESQDRSNRVQKSAGRQSAI